jgi:transposase
VDDWAWRRGHRYGTVLIDLERHKPIDLLPDREADTLADWLRNHPSVQIISRDRAGAYADGARRGAPEAVQVADRFHLFCNFTSERLTRVLQAIQPPPAAEIARKTNARTMAEPVSNPVGHAGSEMLNQHEQERQQHREKRKVLFDAVIAAYQRGLTKRAIANELKITRMTVRRYLRAKEFPERAPRQRRSELDSYREYLEKRWAEGCHNASQLFRELRRQGYGGQRSRVKEYLQPWRTQAVVKSSDPPRVLPNLKLVAFWLAKPAAERTPDEQAWVTALTAGQPQVADIERLAQQFRQVFKDRKEENLRSWLAQALASGVPELDRFVTGIQRDYDAVEAAVVQPWSNGQVEGQVHRIKLLKRQMYGRSGFALLRRRVLPFCALCPQRSP